MKASSVNRPLRLVIIDSDGRARSYVRQAFSENDIRVVGEADDVKSGLRFVRGLQPDIVLMELPENAAETMEALRKLKDDQPGLGVVLSRHDPSPQLILSAMRAGAQEFVGRPIDAPELEKAIGHVRRQLTRTTPSASKRGTVVSVFSCKGGVGATSVVANLGVELARRDETRTVLVDLNFQMGDLGVMLDLPPRYSLTDALVEGRLDETRLRSVLSQHDSGADVLTVATSPEVGEDITRHHLVDLFGILTRMYDYIVVDVGRQLDDRTVEVLELSSEVLLLSTMDVSAVRNASRYMAMLDRLQIDRSRMRLVVNRFDKKSRLSLNDMEAVLDTEAFWSIPNDFEPISLGIDRGNPAVLGSRRSKAARSFRKLATEIAGGLDTSKPEPVDTPDVTPVPRKKMKPVKPHETSEVRKSNEIHETPETPDAHEVREAQVVRKPRVVREYHRAPKTPDNSDTHNAELNEILGT